jgi:hypothetical protein
MGHFDSGDKSDGLFVYVSQQQVVRRLVEKPRDPFRNGEMIEQMTGRHHLVVAANADFAHGNPRITG